MIRSVNFACVVNPHARPPATVPFHPALCRRVTDRCGLKSCSWSVASHLRHWIWLHPCASPHVPQSDRLERGSPTEARFNIREHKHPSARLVEMRGDFFEHVADVPNVTSCELRQ